MPHNGGKAQGNFWFASPYIDNTFIDMMKMCLLPWFAFNSGNTESTSEDWRLLFDSRGYPTRMSNGVGDYWRTSQLWIYGTTGDVWVLDCPANVTCSMQAFFAAGGISESIISSTRREYTLTGTPTSDPLDGAGSANPALLVAVRISAMTAGALSGGQIRLYRKGRHETLLNKGVLFNPDFKSRAKGVGVLRLMDYMQTNVNNTALWSHRHTLNDFTYCGQKLDSQLWCGTSTGTNNQVVSQPPTTIPSLPLPDGQIVQWKMGSDPVQVAPTACTIANPGVFTKTAHGFTNGENVEGCYFTAQDGNWGVFTNDTAGRFKTLTVTVVDADHFHFGISTVGFAAFTPGLTFYRQVTLKIGSLAAIPCTSRRGINFTAGAEWPSNRIITGLWDSMLGRLLIAELDDYSYMNPGMPVEVGIRLANETGAHPHFNIPFNATDDYVTQFATLVRDNLQSGLIPRFEYTNECWNSGFKDTSLAICRAMHHPTLSLNGNFHQYYGLRVYEIAQLIKAVYAGTGKSYQMVLACQGADLPGPFGNNIDRLRCPPFSLGDTSKYPINSCHTLQVANYVVPAFTYYSNAASYNSGALVNAVYNYKQGGGLRQTAYDWLKAEHINNTQDGSFPTQQPTTYWKNTALPAWKTEANTYGVTLSMYEGSLGIPGPDYIDGGFPTTHVPSGTTITTADVYNFYLDFLQSQQAADLVTLIMSDVVAVGGVFPSQYVISGPWGAGATWSLYRLNSFTAGPTLSYQAFRTFNDPVTSFCGGKAQLGLWYQQGGGMYPFLNHIKMAQEWSLVAGGFARASIFDVNGYPTVLTDGSIETVFPFPTQAERPGNYRLRFRGIGTVSGRTTTGDGPNSFTVTAPEPPFNLQITATNAPPNHIRDISFVHVDDVTAYDAGTIWGTLFKAKLLEGNFAVIRWMDSLGYLGSNNSNQRYWADRKPLDYVYYAGSEPRAGMWGGTTSHSGNAYTVSAPPGFVLQDKAIVIVKWDATSTPDATPTINVGSTGIKNVVREFGTGLWFGTSAAVVGRISTLVYDADIGAYLKFGGDDGAPVRYLDNGMPPELLLHLCIEVGAHPHFVPPYMACDPPTDWYALLADYCRDRAPTWMKPIFESGPNECWNNQFYATGYARTKEKLRNGNVDFDEDNWYGRTTSKNGQDISAVYGDDRTKYEVAAGFHTLVGSPSAEQDNRLESPRYYTETGSDNSKRAKFWVTKGALATYFGSDIQYRAMEIVRAWNYAQGTTLEKAVIAAAFIDDGVPSNLAALLAKYQQWRTYFNTKTGLGILPIGYEGGHSPDFLGPIQASAAGYAPNAAPILNATKASSCVLTFGNDDYGNAFSAAPGMRLLITGVGGMTQLNGNTYIVTVANGNLVSINVDSSTFGTYTSGGIATYRTAVGGDFQPYLDDLRRGSKYAASLKGFELQNFANFESVGGTFPSEYVMAGADQAWQMFVPDIYATPSTRWQASIEYNHPSGIIPVPPVSAVGARAIINRYRRNVRVLA